MEHGNEKMERMRPVAEAHGLSMLEFACSWNLSQEPVRTVVPTFIQEAGDGARPIEEKIKAFADLSEETLTAEEVEAVRAIGDNTGCMPLLANKRPSST